MNPDRVEQTDFLIMNEHSFIYHSSEPAVKEKTSLQKIPFKDMIIS